MVLRSEEASWKSVVEPIFDTEHSVLLAPLFEVEPIAKAVRKVEEEARCTPRVANGVVEPTPREPPTVALFETVSAEVEALVRMAR